MAANVLTRVAVLVFLGSSGCVASPEVTEVRPSTGDIRGGQLVRLEGRGFGHEPVEVFFGVQAAKAIRLEGERLITVVAPVPEQSGSVDVRLRFATGVEITAPSQYLYQPVDGMRIDITPFGSRTVAEDRPAD